MRPWYGDAGPGGLGGQRQQPGSMGVNAGAAFPFGPGDRAAEVTGTGGADQPPDEFNSYVVLVLWKQGVDVTALGAVQTQQIVTALWQDPFIQNLYSSAYVGTYTTDPSTGIPITDANFETAINNELFDTTKTHSQFLLSQGVQALQLSGRQLTSAQQSYAQNLGGGSPATLQALARAAQETGVPYNVALAVAMAESGLNASQAGDFDPATGKDCSYGLFQLNTCGGEGQGMSMTDLMDPYTNARVALQKFAAVAQENPGITSDPGAWAAKAQRPRDPTGYATRVNNLLQSGFGGSPSSLVPRPFDGSFQITKDHSDGDPGIDYGTPVGTRMYTPFAGTIRVEDQGKGGWGKRAMVVLDNGYTYAVGHLTSFSVSDGQRVNPGDILGLSGGAVDDPSSGLSDGPHVEIQWLSPGGNFLDPHSIIDPILAGSATFRSLNLTGAEGSGVSSASARDRLLGIDPALEAKYPAAVSGFQKYFGRRPNSQELTSLVAATGGQPDAVDQYLRMQPSHIPGVSMGMYTDVKGNLDSVSNQLYGHAGTDGMVKALVDEGKTSPTGVKFFLEQADIAGQMSPGQYATIYRLNVPHMDAIYNANGGFDPSIAIQQHQQAQAQGVTVPESPPLTSEGAGGGAELAQQ